MPTEKTPRVCGNCHTIKPFNETHVTCLNQECRSCGTLVSKCHAGCKHFTAAGGQE